VRKERLIAARKEKKLSQDQVAKELGINRSTYACYEIGHREPSILNLKKISKYFNRSIEELF